jgi:hypothetical protein
LTPATRAEAGAVGVMLGATGGTVVGLLIGGDLTTERWREVPVSSLRVGLAPLPAGRLGLGAAVRF